MSFALLLMVTSAIESRGQRWPSSRDIQSESSLLAIRQAFEEDPSLHNVTVDSSDGFIYLAGSVNILEDARRAVREVQDRARSIGIVNRIKVLTPTVTDANLQLQLEAKLRERGFSIRVRVRRGIVKLAGGIASESERDSILTNTCNTPGVKGVYDLMQVRNEPSRDTVQQRQ